MKQFKGLRPNWDIIGLYLAAIVSVGSIIYWASQPIVIELTVIF